jgi:RNA polymerase-binding transcription factor DksA
MTDDYRWCTRCATPLPIRWVSVYPYTRLYCPRCEAIVDADSVVRQPIIQYETSTT